MCILQDDTSDWEAESAEMADIYSNSFLTIAASLCPDNSSGIFSDRWTSTHLSHDHSFIAPCGSVSMQHRSNVFQFRPRLHIARDPFEEMENAASHNVDALS